MAHLKFSVSLFGILSCSCSETLWNNLFQSFLVRLCFESPVIKVNDFTTLSDLLLKIKLICIWDDVVILVGSLIACVKSKLSVICLRAFLLVQSSQLILKSCVMISFFESHSFSMVFRSSQNLLLEEGGRYSTRRTKDT